MIIIIKIINIIIIIMMIIIVIIKIMIIVIIVIMIIIIIIMMMIILSIPLNRGAWRRLDKKTLCLQTHQSLSTEKIIIPPLVFK